MDKVYRKQYRISGDKRERLGINIGIRDKHNIEIRSGDIIRYHDENCIVLYNKEFKTWDAMLIYSCWYGDKDRYNPDSYGKSYQIPMDNGDKMNIEIIERIY